MATRYPLVLNGGQIEQLQSGDTLEGVAGIPAISEGDSGKVLAVKSDESGAEWSDGFVPTSLTTTTPTASSIPVADANGDIDSGWIKDATVSVKGVVELATSAETQTGTDTARAVTPAGLKSLFPLKVMDFEYVQRLGTEARVFSLASLGSGVVLAGTYPTGQIYKSHEIEVHF
jgi:hypothetical protein